MGRYRIEVEGYNDGLPYEEGQHTSCVKADEDIKRRRKENPKVRFRLIEVIEDFSF